MDFSLISCLVQLHLIPQPHHTDCSTQTHQASMLKFPCALSWKEPLRITIHFVRWHWGYYLNSILHRIIDCFWLWISEAPDIDFKHCSCNHILLHLLVSSILSLIICLSLLYWGLIKDSALFHLFSKLKHLKSIWWMRLDR